MTAALVIGASGQVGSACARSLEQAGHRVTGTYSTRPAAGLTHLDLRDCDEIRRVIRSEKPGLCVLSAAMTNVDRCEDDPDLARALNADAALVVAEACREIHAKVVLLSTEYVFDGTAGPYGESDAVNPLSVYGATKLEGERDVLAVDSSNLVVRTTVVYSHRVGDRNFLMQLTERLGRGERMRVPVDQVSTPTYALDLGAAIAKIFPVATGILHLAGPDRLGRHAFAVRAARALGLDPGLLEPVETSTLRQRASRPLSAGLTSERDALLALVEMRGVEGGVGAAARTVVPGRDFL